MTSKQKYIIAGGAVILAFAAGRWASPTKVVTETKIVEVESKTENTSKEVNRDRHKETTSVEETNPDGTKKTTTTTVEDDKTQKNTDVAKSDETSKNSTISKEVTYSTAKVTISALAGVPLSVGGPIVFGAAVTKPILGPLTVGIFGFSSGLVGASVGLTF